MPDTGTGLVGRALKVLWPDDELWYEGVISKFNPKKMEHQVTYDDGDTEWLSLEKEQYEWLPARGSAPKRPARSRAIVDSSDEEEEGPEPTAKDESGSEYAGDSDGGSESEQSMDAEEMVDSDAESSPPAKKKQKATGGKPVVKVASKPASRPLPAAVMKNAPKSPASRHTNPPTKVVNPPVALPKSVEKLTLPGAGSPAAAACAELTGGLGLALTDEAQRFQTRMDDLFSFATEAKRLDRRGHRPGHPHFDPSLLQLPKSFPLLNGKALSGAQEQWWRFKADHFDAVIFFKMGKFYELFEMDAHVGVEQLGLSYMRCEQPHAGFPEKAYASHAERLVRRGFRVVVVEQVETPDMLAARKAKDSKCKDKVVRREKVAGLSLGTLTDYDMLAASPDAAILLSVTELPRGDGVEGSPQIGVCALDAAVGLFQLCQFTDDGLRSTLRNIFAQLRPVELLMPREGLSEETAAAIHSSFQGTLQRRLDAGTQMWEAERTMHELREGGYFGAQGDAFPELLTELEGAGVHGEAALSAFGGCVFHLKDFAQLDRELLPLRCVERLPGVSTSVTCAEGGDTDMGTGNPGPNSQQEAYVELDAAALKNLEVLENSEGGAEGTLLAHLDHCVTAAGRRRLKQWLCRPLRHAASIAERQAAVVELRGKAFEAAQAARTHLRRAPDLPRLLARLQAACTGGTGRSSAHVVLYEDHSRKRLMDFLIALRGLESIKAAALEFRDVLDDIASPKLCALVTSGSWRRGSGRRVQGLPDLHAALHPFREAFSWERAEQSGRIIPSKDGVDKDLDAANAAWKEAEKELEAYLKQQRTELKCSKIEYINNNKDLYVMEMPDSVKNVPGSYEKCSQRKGFVRYTSVPLEQLKKVMAAAEEKKEAALKGIMQNQLQHFGQGWETWQAAASVACELDALCSLAAAAESYPCGAVCMPQVGGQPGDDTPFFEARALRHPCMPGFVPNDTTLGGEGTAPFMLITGPNMGGKSTLLRQTCLAAVMAQVGAAVPAESLAMSPVDAIFVRMGAQDNILANQSTFLVELAETTAVLERASRHSLVALDELGRGTATSDGAAIAFAVLRHLAHSVRCRTLFSTHYHTLADEHVADPALAIVHMGCRVKEGHAGDPEEVTFLYTLTAGACPKSYGVNVARLAGLPAEVLASAAGVAAAHEAEGRFGGGAAAPKVGEDSGQQENAQEESELTEAEKFLLEKLLQHDNSKSSDDLHELWNRASSMHALL
ncbi:hypothetical protein CYMTET_56430 [Cymbomonas tetramitiformis]|uniref:DNA mismatch repair protein n=1 Tax=Cymbomonas tetramitiformis TaxID=36881 RepID=A0AAE0ENR9_9CHLO|nr:hypothetical protein CYMTET_56430 [Cymbomonas tetramitiformis]